MVQHLPYMCNRYSTLCIAFVDYCTSLEYEAVALEKCKLDKVSVGKEIMSIISANVTPANCPLILSPYIKYTPVELVAKIRGDYVPNVEDDKKLNEENSTSLK